MPASFWAASATAEEGEEERAETMFTRAPRGYTDGEDTLTGCEMTLSCGVHELHAILFGPQSTLDAQLAAATNVTLSAVSTWRCNAHGLPQRKVCVRACQRKRAPPPRRVAFAYSVASRLFAADVGVTAS